MGGRGGGGRRFGGRGEVTVHNKTTEIELQNLFWKNVYETGE